MTQPAQTWVKLGSVGRPPSRGSAAVGALAVGATKDVVVPISPTMPDASYFPVASIVGTATLVAALALQGITALTTTTVTVRVRATAAVAAGASVNVVAID